MRPRVRCELQRFIHSADVLQLTCEPIREARRRWIAAQPRPKVILTFYYPGMAMKQAPGRLRRAECRSKYTCPSQCLPADGSHLWPLIECQARNCVRSAEGK